MYVIHQYSKYSRSAKILRKELGLKRIQIAEPDQPIKGILNWGCSNALLPKGVPVINAYRDVNKCGNKLNFFKKAEGFRKPEAVFNLNEALEWVEQGHTVFGRLPRGHSGTDIVTFQDNPSEFASRSFWTLYKKKAKEFRVHIMAGEVIKLQQKVLRLQTPDGTHIDPSTVDFKIRTHRNGFIFQQNNTTAPDDVITQAQKAMAWSGLTFGAVDVIWNQYEGKAYVLEINTAPGMEGSTITAYVDGFKKLGIGK